MFTVFLLTFAVALSVIATGLISVLVSSFILEMKINWIVKIILTALVFSFSVSISTVTAISVADYFFEAPEKQLDNKEK